MLPGKMGCGAARPVIQRLFPQQRYTQEDIEAMAAYITRYSLYALRGLAEFEAVGAAALGNGGGAP